MPKTTRPGRPTTRYRRNTAAENAAVDALQYEYIGGGPPPVVPARKPRKPSVSESVPSHAYVLVDGDDRQGWSVLCAFLDLGEAARAAGRAGGQVVVVGLAFLASADDWAPDGRAGR